MREFGRLRAILIRHEGMRLTAYDDATGKPIVAGTIAKGHPTIGVGRPLDVTGIAEAEAMATLSQDMTAAIERTAAAFPWFNSLSPVRQDVLISMVLNM